MHEKYYGDNSDKNAAEQTMTTSTDLYIFPTVPLVSLLVCLSHLKIGRTVGPRDLIFGMKVGFLSADCPGSQLANLYWQLAKTSDEVMSKLFDERESGSSQILCSFLMRQSRVTYETKNHYLPCFVVDDKLVRFKPDSLFISDEEKPSHI